MQRFLQSFRFAFSGIWRMLRTQRNARIEMVIGAAACAMGWWLRISSDQWAILALTIALVLIVEGFNSAIEAVVDLASPQIHPLAKAAKDLAAGMALIAAIASFIVGLLIFGPAIWEKFLRN
jgi:diacylglycerol kinase